MSLFHRKKKYQIEIEGRNFLVLWDAVPQKYGFHTLRYLTAHDEAEAEHLALAQLAAEFKSFILNSALDQPMVRVVVITLIESFGEHEVPGEGADWYLE